MKQAHTLKLLNKLTVTELAQLSNLSKSYISQVKNGKCPPSQKLLNAITNQIQPSKPYKDYYGLFLQSRESMGVTNKTLAFYKSMLSKFVNEVNYLKSTRQDIEKFLNKIPANKNGLATRHASYRVIKTFYRWLNSEYGFPNPIDGMPSPILGKPILPSFEKSQVDFLIDNVSASRDKAIIALFVESGLRLSELTNIKPQHIAWDTRTIRIIGKGRKEAYAPFGGLSEGYLREWLGKHTPNGNIWGINERGIQIMLRRLKDKTGLPCNPHTFRRTFACLLRKQGLDTMTIKDLGRWESLEMVQRYTRSITFQDSLKFYKAPLG
ncbi:tyrosine-type recombinase/integrase [Chloroflexota bacterium]